MKRAKLEKKAIEILAGENLTEREIRAYIRAASIEDLEDLAK